MAPRELHHRPHPHYPRLLAPPWHPLNLDGIPPKALEGISDVQSVSPTLHSGAFPSLFCLSLEITPTNMQRFLEMPFAPLNLTNLYVYCGMRIIRGVRRRRRDFFLVCVSEVFPLLELLHLTMLWMMKSCVCPMREAEDRITFETLEPLLKFRKIV